jgi:hypothetical protein
MSRSILQLPVIVALFAASGCSGRGPVPVSGVVTVEGGGPLAEVNVTFLPISGKGRPATGQTDSEGYFQLTTYQPDDGALPGEYKVTISISVQTGARWDKKSPPRILPILPAYSNPVQTPLTQVVPTEGELRLELKKDVGEQGT